MSENEQSTRNQKLLMQVGIWAFCLGAAIGFGSCWMFFARDSHKVVVVGPTDQAEAVRPARPARPPAPVVGGEMTGFRDRVGQSMLFKVTGVAGSSTIWGTGIYTDDSGLPITTVHSGALKPGETGIIRVTILPGRDRYEGSTRNGITSSNYEKWEGSYRLERVTGPTTQPVLDLPVNGSNQLVLEGISPATGPARLSLSATRPASGPVTKPTAAAPPAMERKQD